jgi:phosphoglycolate phosphatase
MLRKPRLIVFDLDGTLVDSAPDIAYAVDTMLVRMGRPPAGEALVRGWIGNGVPMLVQRALTGEQWPTDVPAETPAAVGCFMDIYADHLCRFSRLYPGVREGLTALRAEGYPLACSTNKHSRFTLPLLQQLDIASYFDFVGSGDQFARQKPDAEPLLRTAAYFGVSPEECLMVGDSPTDAQAARNAGYMLACVPYGYHGGAGVELLEPDVIIGSCAELPALLRNAAGVAG